ncbi:MAG: hypothetical protein PHR00_04430 [Patescibacteria group bacterium]|nr:hypothetical protein [Patescibacteria group bacterium]
MALEGTHIRVAVDLKNKLKIVDVNKYINGTIYPDSRYITGASRTLTHPTDFVNWRWKEIDDFKKGWMLHLLVDKYLKQITDNFFPQLFGTLSDVENYPIYTALKILQDMDDVKAFDAKTYLIYLNNPENRNQEDILKVREYNDIFLKLYNLHSGATIDDYCEIMKKFGMTNKIIAQIKRLAEQYKNDNSIMFLIRKIYPEIIKRVQIELVEFMDS